MNDREKLIRLALEKVREIGEAGKAGVPLQSIPKDVDSNWGWLQGQWPVVVAIDTALAAQPTVDEAKLAEVIRGSMTYKREFEGGQTSLRWNSYPEVARLVNERREEWLRGGGLS